MYITHLLLFPCGVMSYFDLAYIQQFDRSLFHGDCKHRDIITLNYQKDVSIWANSFYCLYWDAMPKLLITAGKFQGGKNSSKFKYFNFVLIEIWNSLNIFVKMTKVLKNQLTVLRCA